MINGMKMEFGANLKFGYFSQTEDEKHKYDLIMKKYALDDNLNYNNIQYMIDVKIVLLIRLSDYLEFLIAEIEYLVDISNLKLEIDEIDDNNFVNTSDTEFDENVIMKDILEELLTSYRKYLLMVNDEIELQVNRHIMYLQNTLSKSQVEKTDNNEDVYDIKELTDSFMSFLLKAIDYKDYMEKNCNKEGKMCEDKTDIHLEKIKRIFEEDYLLKYDGDKMFNYIMLLLSTTLERSPDGQMLLMELRKNYDLYNK